MTTPFKNVANLVTSTGRIVRSTTPSATSGPPGAGADPSCGAYGTGAFHPWQLAPPACHPTVPHLDARPNPDRPNITTVLVDHDDGRVVDDHELRSAYLPGAVDVDASGNAAIRAFLDPLAAPDGLFRAETVTTRTFVVQRTFR